MASSARLLTLCKRCVLNGSPTSILRKQPVRYSQWAPDFLEPTFKKEEFEKELDPADPRKFHRIKSALPDQTCSLIYDDTTNRVIKHILREGNKKLARYIIDRTFEHIKLIQLEKYYKAKTDEQRDEIELNPTRILNKAVRNATPLLTVQLIRKGAVMYEVPVSSSEHYREFKAITWLVDSANEGKSRSVRVWTTLAKEFIDASLNEGKAIRKKQDLHKICEANRAYAHFRWGH